MSKRLKVIFITLSFIVVGMLILRVYINSVLKKVIYEQVKSFSKNNYKLKVDKIDIGVLAFNATIQGFDLKHIPHKTDSIIPYANMKAKSIRLRGLNLMKLVFSQSLRLARFELIDPKVDIFYNSKYADSSSTKAAVDLFTVQIRKLQLKNVQINLFDFGVGITSIKAKNLDYDIKTLNLEINNLSIIGSKTDSSLVNVSLNTGNVDGFYLNDLFNKRTIRYDEIRFDKIKIALSKNKDTKLEVIENSENVKSMAQSKFFTSIKPFSIKQVQFSMKDGNKKMVFNGKKLIYKRRDFSIQSFNLDLYQNFKTQIISKELKIKGMDADSINEGYNIAVDRLELEEPKIKLVLNYTREMKDTETSILKLFSIKRVNFLGLKNGQIEINDAQKKYMRASATNIDFSSSNLLPGNGFIYFENALFNASDLNFNMANNRYNSKINRISYSQKTGNASVINFKLTPNQDKKTFVKMSGKQEARTELAIKTVDLKKLNILTLINYKTFECQKILMDQMRAEFYKDKNIPLVASDYIKFPQEMLREIELGINVDTITIKNSFISSEELWPNASNSGTIELDKVIMKLTGVDNAKSTSNPMMAYFSGRLAKSGLLTATISMPIHDLQCNHTAHFEIDKMPFQNLNKFISELAHVSITKGQLDKAIVDIKGNKKSIACKLELRYHDLTMKILSDEATSTNKNKLSLANKLANALILNNNPMEGEPLRISETKKETELNKFLVENWILATLTSMLETASPRVNNIIKRTKNVKERMK